ncbi:hypothetical protein GCM10007916_28120 [Psychromonas marina]|uniref:Uncharacterized protein n=1 Tax=Psychromonas marina TaxID=88364 RepID=A0ABQ6E2Y1_9GAMM|nr:DUF6653 family protein [Psychromonas marina]GLS91742.1 hypothetical protein GCM10007916_28120 [Psychromonas marina]
MDIHKWAEKAMLMDDEAWNRHANPWSVYSRFTTLPLISLAFWSREWIDIYSVLLIALSFLWVWVNPRLFSVPKSTNNWASMGTFGERIYLNRHNQEIPIHHLKTCRVLQSLSAIGLPFFVYGLYALDIGILILGNLWIMIFKAWFVDRMVWLYMEMKESNP